MDLLADLLADDPATPRLTVYQEDTGARLDFSALTLDNWAAKVGNMLREEFEAEPGETFLELRLAVGWQAVVIALGAVTAGIDFTLSSADSPIHGDIVFCRLDEAETIAAAAEESGAELVVLSDDPFGRGVTEIGKELPSPEAVDFGPTVRFYGDQFFHPVPPLKDLVDNYFSATSPPNDTRRPICHAGHRYLSTGWHSTAELWSQIFAPLADRASVVVVSGLVSTERLKDIAQREKVDHRL